MKPHRNAHVLALCLSVSLLGSSPAFNTLFAGDLILTDPDYGRVNATAMDQPRMEALLTDGGEVMQDADGPVRFRAFIDTGSSGFVLSHLVAEGHELYESGSLGLGEEDYIGVYTNLGIGGEELGNISRPLGILLYNGQFPTEGEVSVGDYIHYGEHNLWVRKAPGIGEFNMIDLGEGIQYPLVSPVNIVGMPVIEQRVMVMEWLRVPDELFDLLEAVFPGMFLPTIRNIREMETRLLPRGDETIPPTNITLPLGMRDFVGDPRPGETLPSVSNNPVVKNVRISHDPGKETITADWLFDTGAGSSFISFAWAQAVGLIPEHYPDLEAFMVDHVANEGLVSQIGGIGPETVEVPVLDLQEIRIAAEEGFDLVWQNVKVLVFEHAELADLDLQGIFGMNLIGPAATVDTSILAGYQNVEDNLFLLILLLAQLSDASPTPFERAIFEVTGEDTAELRLFSRLLPSETFAHWISGHFDPEELATPSISGPQADPDGDGVPNLLEYALGRDPRLPSRDGLPEPEIQQLEGQAYLTLTYERMTAATDIEFLVESSNDLTTWATNEAVIVEVIDLGDRERITVRDSQPLDTTSPRFLRLRVNLVGE